MCAAAATTTTTEVAAAATAGFLFVNILNRLLLTWCFSLCKIIMMETALVLVNLVIYKLQKSYFVTCLNYFAAVFFDFIVFTFYFYCCKNKKMTET